MDEESKPLTAFTVGLLGFYECNRMPFRFTNAPATFQRLMETCLGDLNLHWCIIYLDRQLAYLGHVISAKGVATDESKIEAIKNMPTPTNITKVRSFLGFTG